ncbi:MAG: hypothetical protein QM831_32545 [Kofleriaceae bacterium]
MRAVVLCLVAACHADSAPEQLDAQTADAQSTVDAFVPYTGPTKLGLFPQGSFATPPTLPYASQDLPPDQLDGKDKLALASALGATLVRTQARFLGANSISGVPYAQQISASTGLVLTVLPNPANADGSTPPLEPANDDIYKANLESVIASTTPFVIMVENEENAANFYSGTPDTYAHELAVTTQVAHAHGIPVTNGGLTNIPIRLVTWYAFVRANDWTSADAFAQATFPNPSQFPSGADPTKPIPAGAQAQIDLATQYIHTYATSDIDYLDVHLYEVPPVQMAQELDFLASQVGKPIVSTEMGQYTYATATNDPVANMLGVAVDHHFPFVIWYSGDGNPAVALHNTASTTSYSLRDGGTSYATFAEAHAQ